MAKDRRDEVREFRTLMNALADSVEQANDDDILDDARQAGVDIESAAGEVRHVLHAAVKGVRQQRLKAARAQYLDSARALQRGDVDLPASADDCRDLLAALVAQQPAFVQALTIQHRDLSQLSEEDVRSALRQLAALGLLEGSPEK